MEDKHVVTPLYQVGCYEIPPKGTGARNCKWLCCRIGTKEEFPKHGEGLSKDIYKRSTNMALAKDTLHIRGNNNPQDWTKTYLGCAIDNKTSSSNSIGPGINRVWWAAWEDILYDDTAEEVVVVVGEKELRCLLMSDRRGVVRDASVKGVALEQPGQGELARFGVS